MLVLDEAAKRRSIVKNPFGFMLSALCHDFGKAMTTEKVNGINGSTAESKSLLVFFILDFASAIIFGIM